MGGKSKVATLCECLQALFECGVFGEGNACPAVTARGMVMVFVKGLAELQPIFPSSGYTHNDVEVLKDFASTVPLARSTPGHAAISSAMVRLLGC